MSVSISDLEALYRTHGGVVRRRIRRFYRNPEEIDEVLQEVFLRVLVKQNSFKGHSSLSTWLNQVTTRYCLNRLRDQKRRVELMDQHGTDMFWSQSISQERQEAQVLLGEIWHALDEELMLIATYHYIDGMTRSEVAKAMGCSLRTIGLRLNDLRARARRVAGEA